MKKTFLIAALFIGVLLFAGGHSETHSRTVLGKSAPALCVERADSIISLDRLRGEYVLVNFWSSTDAASRRAAYMYTAWQRRHPGSDLQVIGVNFDDSEGLFREIVRLDSLEPAQQYHAAGDTARAITDNYGLAEGYGSVLIDPEGKIVAYNPTENDLDAILSPAMAAR